jgi:hypothetical protein
MLCAWRIVSTKFNLKTMNKETRTLTEQLELFGEPQMAAQYYNTTQLTGAELIERKVKAKSQQEIVYAFFKQHPMQMFTPAEVHFKTQMQCPLTSIRRCITNLENDGYLLKTNQKQIGNYGVPNFMWKLKC